MTLTYHYLVPVRDRPINPYIFINNIKRRIQIRAALKKNIFISVTFPLQNQIRNGQIFYLELHGGEIFRTIHEGPQGPRTLF